MQGDEFLGAFDPIIYSALAFSRYVLTLLLLVIFSRKVYPKAGHIFRSIAACYLILFVILVVQALLFQLLNIEVGYIFSAAGRVRYGGIVGEPQTAAAWLFSLFFILYLFLPSRRYFRGHLGWLLICSQLLCMLLTQSTTWLIAFWFFLMIYSGHKTRIFLLVFMFFVAQFTNAMIFEKIYAEIFQISERSITIAAGYELFSSNIYNTLFGYGLGLSPYVITKTEIFSLYPYLDLSSLGRQNVMNSYLEIFFELGLVGATLIFSFFDAAMGVRDLKSIILILPLLIGVFSIGGGFFSGYFILAAPLTVRLATQSAREAIEK